MDFDTQLKLQSFLDGELPEDEAREVASMIARDEEARALHAELKNTRNAVKGSKTNVQLPESREFFWSKIERDIQRLEPAREEAPSVPLFERLRRLLMPVSAVAVIIMVGLLTYNQVVLPGRTSSTETDMAMADSGAFTYRDYSSGMTLVWLPYPAENDLAQNNSPATIQ